MHCNSLAHPQAVKDGREKIAVDQIFMHAKLPFLMTDIQ